MSVEVHEFRPDDLRWLEPRERHARTLSLVMARMRRYPETAVRVTTLARTVVEANGRVLACAGVLPGGEAWAFVSRDAKRHARFLVRAAQRALTEWRVPVYAKIDVTDEAAVRFAELIGFRFQEAGVWRYDPGPA